MSAMAIPSPLTPTASARAVDELDHSCGDSYNDDCGDYFASTYRPLSNLPTPPPSSRDSSALPSPEIGHFDPSLLGPAVHLVNMLPPGASLATPSVSRVQAMLARAQLPLDTVALAVCILDALSTRFSRAWRLVCPSGAEPVKRHAVSYSCTDAFSAVASIRRIDSVAPEIIILAALVIAAKFTDDGHNGWTTDAYLDWAADAPSAAAGTPRWTPAQLAATERCIMQSLGYRILPLHDADLLADARADMRRAGAHALRAAGFDASSDIKSSNISSSSSSSSAAVDLQLTPPAEPMDDALADAFAEAACRHHTASKSECFVHLTRH